MDREFIIEYLSRFMGAPYVYGGNNPVSGFDCSGFLCEGLRSVGLLNSADLSALGIKNKFQGHEKLGANPERGDLLFFGLSKDVITHCAIAINKTQMLECGGSNRSTINKVVSASNNAFVRVRLIKFRKDLVSVVKTPYLNM